MYSIVRCLNLEADTNNIRIRPSSPPPPPPPPHPPTHEKSPSTYKHPQIESFNSLPPSRPRSNRDTGHTSPKEVGLLPQPPHTSRITSTASLHRLPSLHSFPSWVELLPCHHFTSRIPFTAAPHRSNSTYEVMTWKRIPSTAAPHIRSTERGGGGGGAVAQSVERGTHGEEVPGSIPAVAACFLLVGSVSV